LSVFNRTKENEDVEKKEEEEEKEEENYHQFFFSSLVILLVFLHLNIPQAFRFLDSFLLLCRHVPIRQHE
jgi:hypothetical protein